MIRPAFRAIAGVMGAAFLLMGALMILKEALSPAGLSLRTEWRGALFMISWGVIFIFIAARGYLKR